MAVGFGAPSNAPAWNLTKVFGRDKELKQLDDLVQERNNHSHNGGSYCPSLITLHGVAGSGKSALIRSFPWEEKGWMLASGKFEKHRRTEPYSAIIEALDDLVEQWTINNSKAKVCQMAHFHNLLVEDIEFLRNILPKAFLVSGSCLDKLKQDAEEQSSELFKAVDMSSADSVNASFRRILSFLTAAKPVVLFLDDIHWADRTSLDVLKALVSCGGPIERLLIAVSYRDEEMEKDHIASICLEEIRAQQGENSILSIPILDLDLLGINNVVASITRCDIEETRSLAEVIFNKTAGNALFVIQFLQLLRDESFFTYSFSTFKWEWGDVDKLQAFAQVSDNVADVIASTLYKLPEATQVTLKVASCLGKVMPLEVLCEYFDSFFEEETSGHTCCAVLMKVKTIGLQNILDHAVEKGFLIHHEDTSTYVWAHDKLQHVAYSLIPDPMRPSLHMRLGKLLWRLSSAYPEADWMIFMAAEQFNRFSNLEPGKSLGPEAARLNLKAAQLSMEKSALFPAMDMLRAGAKNINNNPKRWNEFYELCLELYSFLGEAAVQLGQIEEAMEAVKEVEEHAKSLDDKFRSQCVMLRSVISGSSRDYSLGVEKAIEILKLYGEKLPSKLLPGQLFIENQRLKSNLPGGRLEGLMDLPDMTDKRSKKVTRLLLRYLSMYAMMSNQLSKSGLGALATIRALNIACAKGLCSDTAMGVLGFAANLKREGHYQDACEYAEFAIKLVNKYPQSIGSMHGTVLSVANVSIFPSMRPFNNTMDGILEAYRIGLRTGETEKAISGILGYSWAYLCIGLPLGPLESDLISYGREASQLGMPYTVQVLFKVLRQTVMNLKNKCDKPTILVGEAMDQESELAKFEGLAAKMTLRDMNTFRLVLACIYNDWKTAEEMVDFLEPYLVYDGFAARSHLRSTYMGLASLVLSRKTGKKKYRNIAKKVMKTFKSEAKHGSVNAHPILVMLEAEVSPSKENFEKAIRICARLGLVHHEAYLCERAGVYFLEQKDSGWGEFYLVQASALYGDWGANGKIISMKEEYGEHMETSITSHTSANSALKGRPRYSARDSKGMTEVSWSSFSTSASEGGSSRTSLRSSVSSTSSSDEGKSSEHDSDEFHPIAVDWI